MKHCDRYNILNINTNSHSYEDTDFLCKTLQIEYVTTSTVTDSLEYLMDHTVNAIVIHTNIGLREVEKFLEIMNEDIENENTSIILISDLEDVEELSLRMTRFNVISIFNYKNFHSQFNNLLRVLQLNLDNSVSLKNQLVQSETRNTIDPLTGAFNRYGAQDKFHYLTSRFKAYKENFSLIMLDIDHFKRVNDTHGHDVGDEVLISISSILKDSIRINDALIRFGGEEFFVFLSNVNLEVCEKIAEKLRLAIKEHPHSSKSLDITASFGVVEYQIEDDLDSLIKRSDILLYKAKQSGRDRVISV